jgi:hypothetical protein
MNQKLTLGQAIDEMIGGKTVVIGDCLYRIKRNFLHSKLFEKKSMATVTSPEREWEDTTIGSWELNSTDHPIHVYVPPIEWQKATWLEALHEAMINKKPVKMHLKEGNMIKEKMVDYTDFHYWTIEWICRTDHTYYIEDTF